MSRGIAVFLVAAFVSAVLFAYSQQSKPGRDTQPRVPFLEGRELAAAQQAVGDDFKLTESEQNSRQPDGTILGQLPEAGSEAQQGEKVSVVVSAGPRRVAVPRVVGKPLAEAEGSLISDGFEVRVKTRESSDQENGKVIAQYPSDGEADRGSEIEITVGQAALPAPGYNEIEDPTGSLTLEVPPDWGIEVAADSEGEGGPHSWSYYAGTPLAASITTAHSLDVWYEGQGGEWGSGAYVVASRSLAQKYTDDELIHSVLFDDKANKCSPGPYEDFERSSYSGKMQTWYGCSGNDNTFFIAAAAPQGRKCVVVLNAKISPGASEEDQQAVRHILDSFEVDCDGIA